MKKLFKKKLNFKISFKNQIRVEILLIIIQFKKYNNQYRWKIKINKKIKKIPLKTNKKLFSSNKPVQFHLEQPEKNNFHILDLDLQKNQ